MLLRSQPEAHRRTVLPRLDGERGVERARTLLEHLDRPPAALAWGVVVDLDLEPAAVAFAYEHGELRRRAAIDRALERLAHDLVQRGLCSLAQPIGGVDLELDVHAVLERAILSQRLHGC